MVSRKYTVAVLLLLATLHVGSTSEVGGTTTGSDVVVVESHDSVTRLRCQVSGFTLDTITVNGEEMCRVHLAGEANIMEKGAPDMPKVCRSIITPDNAQMEIEVVGASYTEYQIAVAPSSGFILRGQSSNSMSETFSDVYRVDDFYPRAIAALGHPYVFRDFRGVVVTLFPFTYNPQTKTLRVYSLIEVEMRAAGLIDENVNVSGSRAYCRHFTDLYDNHFLNFGGDRYDAVDERGRMVVISEASLIDVIQPYVDWKRQKGIPTSLYDVADIGSTPEEIKSFIQSEYDMGDGLVFVQLVGDEAQVPTFMIDCEFCGGMATSDATYSLLAGSDSYPEIFVGRFSAETKEELETQVERTIYYERDLNDGDWLHRGTGVGSAWGDGYGYLGMRDRELVEVLRVMLLEYTYTEVDQLYELGDPPFDIVPVPVPDFMHTINDGRGILIVEGHGDCECTFMIPPGTPTPGDVFTTDSIYILTNDYQLPFVTLGAPYLGNFQIGQTFAEAWLRATNSSTGAPVGAIAVYASSTDLDYASPQAAQHEMVELLASGRFNTIGGLFYNGSCHAVDLYGERGEKTFKSYHVFGDVSLQVRTDTPEPLTVECDEEVLTGATTFEVTVPGVEGALCALSHSSDLLGCAYTDQTGQSVIVLDQPVGGSGPLDLVVTAYNKTTYLTQVAVVDAICGDIDGSCAIPDICDLVYLVDYMFNDGPEPLVMDAANVDGQGDLDIADLVYLVDYMFNGGPELTCP